MPIFLASLLGGLISVAGTLVGRVLIAMGIGYVTYTGVNILLTSIKNNIWSSMSGLSSEILGALAYMQVDVCINILFSAVAARLVLNGLTSDGKISKMIVKS